MSPDQKPEWFEIADTDNAATPRKVAKTLPLVGLLAAVAIIGLGAGVAQTQQESPASAVESILPVSTSTEPVNPAVQTSTTTQGLSSTPAVGSASMETTNPNAILNSVPSPVQSPTTQATSNTEEPAMSPAPKPTVTIKAPTPIKPASTGVRPPKGGEHEGKEHNAGSDDNEGSDD